MNELEELREADLAEYPSEIRHYAYNCIAHQILISTKHDLFLYDIQENKMIKTLEYRKIFGEHYGCEIKIRFLDSCDFSNTWIALVNHKSILFFNEELKFSRIHTPENNNMCSIYSLQRSNEFFALREDRKAVKLWRFHFTDVLHLGHDPNEQSNNNSKSKKKKGVREKLYEAKFMSFKKRMELNLDQEVARMYHKKGESFDVELQTKVAMNAKGNRQFLQVIFNEELGILIGNYDNKEVGIYSLVTGEIMETITLTQIQSEKDPDDISCIAAEQELLYFWDSKRLIIYDLILKQQIHNIQHGLNQQIIYMHAEKCNSQAGLYLLSSTDDMYVYSIEERRTLSYGKIARSDKYCRILDKYHLDTKRVNTGYGDRSAISHLLNRISPTFKIYTNTQGENILLVSLHRNFMGFKIDNPFKVVKNIQEMIISAEIITPDRDTNDGRMIVLKTHDHNIKIFDFQTLNLTKDFDILKEFNEAAFFTTEGNPEKFQLNSHDILDVIHLNKHDLFIIRTKDVLHLINLRIRSRMYAKLKGVTVHKIDAIKSKQDSNYHYRFFAGIEDGYIMVLDCDFEFRAYSLLKTIPRHDSVLGLRVLEKNDKFLSIGSNGKIILQKCDQNVTVITTNSFIISGLTCINFLSDNEIIAGAANGAIHYLKYDWENSIKIDSFVYKFHQTSIRSIQYDGKDYVSLCENGIVCHWKYYQGVPLHTFLAKKQAHSVFVRKRNAGDPEIYLQSLNYMSSLNYRYGTDILKLNFNPDKTWKQAIEYRNKILKLEKDRAIMPNLTLAIETIEHKKRISNPIEDGPLLNRYLYGDDELRGLKGVQIDFFRYGKINRNVTHIDRTHSCWILDGILLECFEKKMKNEPIVIKVLEKEVNLSIVDEVDKNEDALKEILSHYPTIETMFKERLKHQQKLYMHREIFELINAYYKGENDNDKLYSFLEIQFGIKKSDIDHAYFMQAKCKYYKPLNKLSAPSIRTETSPPATSIPKTIRTAQSPRVKKTQTAAGTMRKMLSPRQRNFTIKTETDDTNYKTFNSNIDMKLSPKFSDTQTSFRNLLAKNPLNLTSRLSTDYTSFSDVKKAGKLKLDDNFNFTLTTSPSSRIGTSNQEFNPDMTSSTFRITTDSFAVKSPSIYSDRSDFYRTFIVKENRTHKDYNPVDSSLHTPFPKRSTRNWIADHSKGFLEGNNADFDHHVMRFFFRNQYFILKKFEQVQILKPKVETKNRDFDGDILEFIPIKIKQFMVEINQKEFLLLDEIAEMYEKITGQKLKKERQDTTDKAYSLSNLDQILQDENDFIKKILSEIKENGIHTIDVEKMIKYKEIVQRRIEIFNHMQDSVHNERYRAITSGIIANELKGSSNSKIVEAIKNMQNSKDLLTMRGSGSKLDRILTHSGTKSFIMDEERSSIPMVQSILASIQKIHKLQRTASGYEFLESERKELVDEIKNFEQEKQNDESNASIFRSNTRERIDSLNDNDKLDSEASSHQGTLILDRAGTRGKIRSPTLNSIDLGMESPKSNNGVRPFYMHDGKKVLKKSLTGGLNSNQFNELNKVKKAGSQIFSDLVSEKTSARDTTDATQNFTDDFLEQRKLIEDLKKALSPRVSNLSSDSAQNFDLRGALDRLSLKPEGIIAEEPEETDRVLRLEREKFKKKKNPNLGAGTSTFGMGLMKNYVKMKKNSEDFHNKILKKEKTLTETDLDKLVSFGKDTKQEEVKPKKEFMRKNSKKTTIIIQSKKSLIELDDEDPTKLKYDELKKKGSLDKINTQESIKINIQPTILITPQPELKPDIKSLGIPESIPSIQKSETLLPVNIDRRNSLTVPSITKQRTFKLDIDPRIETGQITPSRLDKSNRSAISPIPSNKDGLDVSISDLNRSGYQFERSNSQISVSPMLERHGSRLMDKSILGEDGEKLVSSRGDLGIPSPTPRIRKSPRPPSVEHSEKNDSDTNLNTSNILETSKIELKKEPHEKDNSPSQIKAELNRKKFINMKNIVEAEEDGQVEEDGTSRSTREHKAKVTAFLQRVGMPASVIEETFLPVLQKKKNVSFLSNIDDEILKNPLKVFEEILHEDSIDPELKLNIFVYGNRKEILTNYIKDLDSEIDMNITGRPDCMLELKEFFDDKMENIMRPKYVRFSNNPSGGMIERMSTLDERLEQFKDEKETQETDIFLNYAKFYIDMSGEMIRKKAFKKRNNFLAHMRNFVARNDYMSISRIDQMRMVSPKQTVSSIEYYLGNLNQEKHLLGIDVDKEEAEDPVAKKKKEIELLFELLLRMLKRLKELNPERFQVFFQDMMTKKFEYEKKLHSGTLIFDSNESNI